jgi:hypothetical protein
MFKSLVVRSGFLAVMLGLVGLWAVIAAPQPAASAQAVATTKIFLPQIFNGTAAVRVKSQTSFVMDMERYVVGEVVNETGVPVYDVTITASFYDAANQLVAQVNGKPFLSQTNPGQTNPFKIVLRNNRSTITRHELSVRWNTSSDFGYQPVTVLSRQIRDNVGVEVFGEVRNDGAQALSFVQIAVSFYDSAGNIVHTESDFLVQETLAPGARAAYQVSTFRTFEFATYAVQTEGITP